MICWAKKEALAYLQANAGSVLYYEPAVSRHGIVRDASGSPVAECSPATTKALRRALPVVVRPYTYGAAGSRKSLAPNKSTSEPLFLFAIVH